MREARSKGLKVVAITNVKGSTVSREADAVIYTQAGMELSLIHISAITTLRNGCRRQSAAAC